MTQIFKNHKIFSAPQFSGYKNEIKPQNEVVLQMYSTGTYRTAALRTPAAAAGLQGSVSGDAGPLPGSSIGGLEVTRGARPGHTCSHTPGRRPAGLLSTPRPSSRSWADGTASGWPSGPSAHPSVKGNSRHSAGRARSRGPRGVGKTGYLLVGASALEGPQHRHFPVGPRAEHGAQCGAGVRGQFGPFRKLQFGQFH